MIPPSWDPRVAPSPKITPASNIIALFLPLWKVRMKLALSGLAQMTASFISPGTAVRIGRMSLLPLNSCRNGCKLTASKRTRMNRAGFTWRGLNTSRMIFGLTFIEQLITANPGKRSPRASIRCISPGSSAPIQNDAGCFTPAPKAVCTFRSMTAPTGNHFK